MKNIYFFLTPTKIRGEEILGDIYFGKYLSCLKYVSQRKFHKTNIFLKMTNNSLFKKKKKTDSFLTLIIIRGKEFIEDIHGKISKLWFEAIVSNITPNQEYLI